MHVIAPRGLDSSSLLIIKSLLTAFIARDGTNSLIKMMFFRTADLSTISLPFFKDIFKRGLHSKTAGPRIPMHQAVSDLRKKKSVLPLFK